MSKFLVNILDLHCCQMALGMLEVKAKIKEFKKNVERKNSWPKAKRIPYPSSGAPARTYLS